jgi:hypothetical protein
MPDPFIFDSTSPRFGLPFLIPGQAQKEAWVNEAVARADALLHCATEGIRADPPSSPTDGETWIIASGATGTWAGKDAMLAARQGSNWLYFEPRDGMRVYDRATGQEWIFSTTWQAATAPAEPSGGAVVDSEARAAISQLIAELRIAGVFPAA